MTMTQPFIVIGGKKSLMNKLEELPRYEHKYIRIPTRGLVNGQWDYDVEGIDKKLEEYSNYKIVFCEMDKSTYTMILLLSKEL